MEADLFGVLGVGGCSGRRCWSTWAASGASPAGGGARSNTRSLLAEEISTPMLV
ncbi:hypothetical protein [Streptomyces sp. NPDC050848]|uniref:hypothetical protein n=1 Tax=Streptomyces sp. NPDC050848 TaxID=3155791 RepID=UPI0033F305A3